MRLLKKFWFGLRNVILEKRQYLQLLLRGTLQFRAKTKNHTVADYAVCSSFQIAVTGHFLCVIVEITSQ